MGGDGGSVIQRVDMVRTKGYGTAQPSSRGGMGYQPNSVRRVETETVDPKLLRQLSMRNCALTQQPLAGSPIVACRAGYLYNKEAVLSRLLAKTLPLPPHITSIKDLVDVAQISICPISRRQLDDGVTRALVLWPCGCMLNSKVVQQSSKTCPVCETKITLSVLLFPDDREAQLKTAMELRSRQKRVRTETVKEEQIVKTSTTGGIYDKIFHNPANSSKTRDAFGREYSSKGVGI